MRAVVITVSSRAAAGVYADEAGPLLVGMLREAGFEVGASVVIPDGREEVAQALRDVLPGGPDLVVTTGGTGLHPKDLTPEGTRDVLQREAPGIAEALRAASLAVTPMAMLSRGVAGLVGRTLVVNLPGSPKGAGENLAVLLAVLPHALDQLGGGDHPR